MAKVFAIWQELSRKDLEWGFGVWKGKFHFAVNQMKSCSGTRPPRLLLLCSVAQHDDVIESTNFYECVETTEIACTSRKMHGFLAAMHYTDKDESNITGWHLEIARLQTIGIDIYDEAHKGRTLDLVVLPVSTQLAHMRWQEFYDVLAFLFLIL